jgi:prepilin-type N-terminal cleavage/methylation domain-containing protein/prepilin-type processing-associated H-X9-DG protein
MMKKGFTLIELLVVIAIIAILAAILFPVFARARAKARQTTCLSNIKNLALATHMYLQDHDETLPFSYMYCFSTPVYNEFSRMNWTYIVWLDSIKPYVNNKDIYKCPETAEDWCSYGYNRGLGYFNGSAVSPPRSGITYEGVSLSDIKRPAEFMMMADRADWIWSGYYVWYGGWTNPKNAYYEAFWLDRHNGGMNVALVDGHAKWYSRNAFGAVNYGGSLYWFLGSDG